MGSDGARAFCASILSALAFCAALLSGLGFCAATLSLFCRCKLSSCCACFLRFFVGFDAASEEGSAVAALVAELRELDCMHFEGDM